MYKCFFFEFKIVKFDRDVSRQLFPNATASVLFDDVKNMFFYRSRNPEKQSNWYFDLLNLSSVSGFFKVFSLTVWFVLSNTEAVKEHYDNILQSVNVKRTMPPNASLWSMIENCKNHENIKLLFDVLQNLRRFVSSLSLLSCCVSFI